jgi:eukaryotic-like serine/threonine-protein kinase
MDESTIVLHLLDTLEHEVVPALEKAPVEVNWWRANRLAESIVTLLPSARGSLWLNPSRHGLPEGAGLISLKSSERLPVLRGFLRQVKRALGPGLRPLPRLGRSEPPRPRGSLPPASVPPSGVSLVDMPRWMPASRTLGAFRVDHPLGHGGGGSVFAAHRVADENEDAPESFALKVPVTVGDVPEEQFLTWFREEAQALVSLPEHPNLAQVVAFDLSAKPKPLLVMEHVHGVSLEAAIAAGNLDLKQCFRILDDVVSGLEAMHRAGIGHLDVKPSNVILREGTGSAVLVDFGLSGRKLRPGCGTAAYGAPEVWLSGDGNHNDSPFAADVYALGCMAFELLAGKMLFCAETNYAQITMHMAHDGTPPGVSQLIVEPELAEIGTLLSRMLDPIAAQRPNLGAVRRAMWQCSRRMHGVAWPVLSRVRWQSAELYLEDLAAVSDEDAEQVLIEVA